MRDIGVGFACIPLGLSGPAPNRTCRLSNATDGRLRALIAANVAALENCVSYVAALELGLFRISSDLVPFGSHPVNRVPWRRLWGADLARIGRRARAAGVRLSMHPGQYTLLNSPSEAVTAAAVDDLVYQANVLEALEQPVSAKLVVHVGGVYGDRAAALKRFAREHRRLPAMVKERLVIENDERCYGAEDVLWVGEALGIPVVFDRFHHRVHSRGDDSGVRRLLQRARATWRARDGRQKVHFSSQQTGGRPGAHGYSIDPDEFRSFLEETRGLGPLDIMIEAKGKEEAALVAARLVRA